MPRDYTDMEAIPRGSESAEHFDYLRRAFALDERGPAIEREVEVVKSPGLVDEQKQAALPSLRHLVCDLWIRIERDDERSFVGADRGIDRGEHLATPHL